MLSRVTTGPVVDLLRSEPRARPFFVAHAQSSLGTGAACIALLVLAHDRFHSAWAITLILLADLGPAMVLGPLLGAATDRWSRRACAVAGDVMRAVAFVGIAYPSIASLLADEQLGGRLDISPRAVSTVGELRTPQVAERLTTAWGSRPFDVYWATEAGILGLECERHRLHKLDDDLLVEVVDEHGAPVPAGQPGHKLLITSFTSRAQPLIRYELDDMVTLDGEPCPCGRPFPVIRAVEGRNDEVLYLAGRDGTEMPVHPTVFRSSLAAQREVRQYEVVQRPDEILVRVIPDRGSDRSTLSDRVTTGLREELVSAGAAPPTLRVEVVESIERDPEKMSKIKLVRSEMRRT